MITIGLTGGMGCGKTTAARFFAEEGFQSIDADALVHDLLAHDTGVRAAITDRFGSAVLGDEGAIDRRRLGKLVFADGEALRWLEDLIHPLVGARWREEIACGASHASVVQIPLLFEKKLEQSFDFTVCVGTSADTQRRRLLEKGLSEEEIARRISLQLPLEEKTARADFFLLNDGSLAFLREQIQRLTRQLAPARQQRSA